MKSPSRPHGFALWIGLARPPCPMYPSCAQSACRACCAERVTAPARARPGVRSGRRTRHTTRTATNPAQTATQSRHAEQTRRADTRTQTRRRAAHRRRRITFADARLERSKERRPAAAACPRASPPRPWRRTCRGTARPRLLDLQLPRRRQTSCPALLAKVALPKGCLRGNRTEGTEFMTEFMDPVRVS